MAKFTVNIKNFIKTLVYGKDEIDTMMAGKADASHEHGDIYYTESEIDTMMEGKADNTDLPTKTSDLTNDGDGTHPFLTEHQSITGKKINPIKSQVYPLHQLMNNTHPLN